jgi:hypothetical protein
MPADPSACRYCGIPEAQHLQQWKPPVGWHVWTEPTSEQRYVAIRANAAERKAATDAR